jgi:F420-non-reducing hydrogenase iron-sulfur subunit
LVLKAFVSGADGVLVGGCFAEEYPYMKDSLTARQGIAALKPLLEAMGVGSERLRLESSSPLEDAILAERLGSFAQTIKELGPSPFRRTIY